MANFRRFGVTSKILLKSTNGDTLVVQCYAEALGVNPLLLAWSLPVNRVDRLFRVGRVELRDLYCAVDRL